MAKKATRVRDAGTGKIVAPEEAKARPKETVMEDASKPSLEKRIALLESVFDEAGGPLAVLYRRRKRGLSD
jgi:hypothetical protein